MSHKETRKRARQRGKQIRAVAFALIGVVVLGLASYFLITAFSKPQRLYSAAGRHSGRRFGAAHAQPAGPLESASQRLGAARARRRRGGDGAVDIGDSLADGRWQIADGR